MEHGIGVGPAGGETQVFSYDGMNRLTVAAAGAWSESYGMDGVGNQWRTSRTGLVALLDAPSGPEWYGNGRNRAVPPGAAESTYFDAAGNRKVVAGRNLTYDAEGRVVGVTGAGTASYLFDGLGRRVRTDVGGVRFATVDALGSTRALTDAAGTVTWRRDYAPYGEELTTANRTAAAYASGGMRRKFTGKERDGETGLDWMKSRYFSGAQGRFTSPDKPFADQFPEDPQSWNLYSYVRNNPLKMVDEDGQSATLVGAIGGGIIGGAVAAWRGESVWKGAASGGIAGAVAGSVIDTGGASLGVLALSGAAGGLSGGVVSRALNGEGTTLKQAAVDAAVGGAVGVVLGAGRKTLSSALSKAGSAAAESGEAAVSPRVQGIVKQIEEGGYKVTVNPKTANQTGNVSISHPNSPGVKLNLRSETHPLPGSGGQRVPHVNVEKVTPRVGATPKKIENRHITQ